MNKNHSKNTTERPKCMFRGCGENAVAEGLCAPWMDETKACEKHAARPDFVTIARYVLPQTTPARAEEQTTESEPF